MTTRPTLPAGLYGIADASFGDPVVAAIQMARAGCLVIQLRAKGWPTATRRAAARQAAAKLAPLGAILIVNDDVDAAKQPGVAGVHLGQGDTAPADARRALGARALIGMSTHSLAQVTGVDGAVDYIGFGPIFGTKTKETGWAPRGIDGLRAAAAASAVPVVAIGGIQAAHLHTLRAAGAHGWAVISALYRTGDVGAQTGHFIDVAGEKGE